MKRIARINGLAALVSLLAFAVGSVSAQSPEMVKSVMSRTVLIIPMDEDSQPLGLGSGFVVGHAGEIATNYHVIEGASSAIVKFPGKSGSYPVVSIIHKDAAHDLAVIKLGVETSPLRLGDDVLSQVGERIMAIGNPEGLTGTVSDGIVSGFRKMKDGSRLMQISAPISPGSSGGPVINKRGEVIGVASSGLLVGQNLNFAVPVTMLKRLMATRKLNLRFGATNLPKRPKEAVAGQKDTSLVKVVDFRESLHQNVVRFSIQNNSRHDIRNLKLLVVWYRKSLVMGRKKERIHYNALLIKDHVPASQAKQIMKKLRDSPRGFVLPEIRILDYEILPTSGVLEFE